MRIATWNVNSVNARLPRLLEWLETTRPDVVCLQETKTAEFPSDGIDKLGYTVAAHGDGRWNGVALLSRIGLDDAAYGFPGEPGFPDPEARRSRPSARATSVAGLIEPIRKQTTATAAISTTTHSTMAQRAGADTIRGTTATASVPGPTCAPTTAPSSTTRSPTPSPSRARSRSASRSARSGESRW